ncbi:bifunctional alpha,alpha-trehalose-phosphate synthase (UDP-forming)/trehalose-phosphatase [Paraliomyxa miuraensis]|nr:bifunctional alpha,alpha-trehalose-phosphate synthase (UDP-forming)/trehalose-phosphatase [Paraliomyxa miuraensis]
MSRLIIVSNRLPVQLDDRGGLVRSTGGLTSAMRGLGEVPHRWVGWPGQLSSSAADGREALTRRLREEQGCEPVFIDDEVAYEQFYEGYSNATLWPLLHYMTERARFEPSWFHGYEAVNRRFADVVLEVAGRGARVWVHDYQLMLLPAMLRAARPDLRIGFFLHVPFPSHEVFRVLPERETVLRGLLGADLIGFHTFGYLRHFRSALLRSLDQDSMPDGALVDGRHVRFGVYPIGHNREAFDRVTTQPRYQAQLEELQRDFGDRRIVLSVERLDYTKGIPHKLQAIDRFLGEHPERRKDTVFFILAVPSRQSVDAYRELTARVQLAIGELNGRYSTFSRQPVHFYNRGTSLERLAALYAFAEVALVTPLVDGMNLVAKEYVDCRGAPGARPGTLILSETAGAAQELAGAILVNPYDAQGVARAIASAIARTPHEASAAMDPMRSRVRKHDAEAWARSFVGDLELESRVPLDPAAEVGDALLERIVGATRLGLILDYDGTLRRFVGKPEDATPELELLELLERLGALTGTRLGIVSGRPEAFLQQHLGHLPAWLVAEHGFRQRVPGGEWEDANPRADLTWLDVVRPILEQAADLTPGTHVEVKKSALVWHYRRADPEFGAWKAGELVGALTEVAANMPVEVHRGHKIVEVASQQVSKGAALDALVQSWAPDLVVACGDDRTDESMFHRRDAYPLLETIKVGPGATYAAWRLPGVAAVRRFLQRIVELRTGE